MSFPAKDVVVPSQRQGEEVALTVDVILKFLLSLALACLEDPHSEAVADCEVPFPVEDEDWEFFSFSRQRVSAEVLVEQPLAPYNVQG